jgi:hypothetical protein
MSSFLDLITSAKTRWDAAVVLLSTWSGRSGDVTPIRGDDEFLQLVDVVRAHFDANPAELDLTDVDRSFILSWTKAGEDPHAVDAVGFGLNLSASAGFARSWRDLIEQDTWRPAEGDVFPAADAPWERELNGSIRTPSPRSMNIDADDHPYARTYRKGLLPVEFDFTLWRPLRLLALNLDVVAAITVNEALDELGLDPPRRVAFRVSAQDPNKQEQVVLQQLERAIEAGAGIIVFPELSTSSGIAARVERRLADEDGQRLVICGSWHETVSGARANNSVGLISGVRSRMRHRKVVEFGDLYPKNPDDRRREGIDVPDPPLLRIYVADQFRFSLTICKDFLDTRVRRTLDQVGANLLLVPALSRTTQPFAAYAGAHVSDAQAVSVVANGPRTMQGAPVAPTAFLARPYEPGDLIEETAGGGPSVLLFSLRSGTSQEM